MNWTEAYLLADMEAEEMMRAEETADRIKQLVAANEAQAAEIERLRGVMAKLTKASDRVHDTYWNSTDGIIVGMYNLGDALREARTTLAAMTGAKP